MAEHSGSHHDGQEAGRGRMIREEGDPKREVGEGPKGEMGWGESEHLHG